MEKKKKMGIVLALLVGAIAVGGVLRIWHFYSADVSADAASLTDLALVQGVHYSCSGGSDAGQSFFFSLHKEEEHARFSCEYFSNDHDSGDREQFAVEDAELPAEYFTELMRLMADVPFPDEHQAVDDGVIVLDAATYSLTVYYASGESRSLENYSSISGIEDFFRGIKMEAAEARE